MCALSCLPVSTLMLVLILICVLCVIQFFRNASTASIFFVLAQYALAGGGVFFFWQGAHTEFKILQYLQYFAAACLVGTAVWLWYKYNRLRLRNWAEENGLTIVKYRRAWAWEGPNALLRSKYQSCYRVEADDKHGRRVLAWVVLGSYMGMDPEKVDAQIEYSEVRPVSGLEWPPRGSRTDL